MLTTLDIGRLGFQNFTGQVVTRPASLVLCRKAGHVKRAHGCHAVVVWLCPSTSTKLNWWLSSTAGVVIHTAAVAAFGGVIGPSGCPRDEPA